MKKLITKEWTIAEHRKMWQWIAEETLKRERIVYKKEYLEEYFPNEDIRCNCFCCEYDTKFDGNACSHCPILWGTEDVTSSYFCERGDDYGIKGLWTLCDYLTMDKQYKEASIIAKKIANLPEK